MTEIQQTIDQMISLMEQLDSSLAGEAPGSLQDRLTAFQKVKGLGQDLRTVEGFLEGLVLESMKDKTEKVGEYQLTKRASATKTTWDHDGLLRKLKQKAHEERFDPETGEIKESEVDRYIGLLTESANISYWRVTALRAHNIYVPDFREVQYGRERLQVELAPRDTDEQPVQG